METKLFEQRTYETRQLVDTFALSQIWPNTYARKWAEAAKVGEKFGFTGQTYLVRIK